MKLAAVVILFKPENIGIEKIKNNIDSYSKYVDKLYLIDNSPSENPEIRDTFPHCYYQLNGNKGGIAGAQNIGCQKALEDGFEWAMTMDQDSSFDPEQIEKYIELVSDYIDRDQDKEAVSFGPFIKDLNISTYWTQLIRRHILSPLKRKVLGKRYKSIFDNPVQYPTEVIASANIISLKIWEEIKFDEYLFIEQVDYDFCHNIISRNKKIVKFMEVHLDQCFGKKQFALLKKNYPNYGPTRMYYIFRNLFIERERFPMYSEKYTDIIHKRLFDCCINTIHPLRNTRIIIKAYRDYKEYMKNQTSKQSEQ